MRDSNSKKIQIAVDRNVCKRISSFELKFCFANSPWAHLLNRFKIGRSCSGALIKQYRNFRRKSDRSDSIRPFVSTWQHWMKYYNNEWGHGRKTWQSSPGSWLKREWANYFRWKWARWRERQRHFQCHTQRSEAVPPKFFYVIHH